VGQAKQAQVAAALEDLEHLKELLEEILLHYQD
jgi:hypothetical protein